MVINVKPIYKRILLKLSGEVLQGKEYFGIDIYMLDRIAQEIKELVDLGIQIGIVIGGGNIFRGNSLSKLGMNRIVSDYIGILATVMNGLAMRDALYRAYVKTSLMSAISLNGICDDYNWIEAINLLRDKYVMVFCAGIGNPLFTTDSAACLRGIEIKADVIMKATKVDGVFSSDPIEDSSAIMYDRLSYSEVLEKELKVMDLAAFTLARDYNLPICVFNIKKTRALYRIVTGEKEGTLIIK